MTPSPILPAASIESHMVVGLKTHFQTARGSLLAGLFPAVFLRENKEGRAVHSARPPFFQRGSVARSH